jgi:hypothetical protein
MRKHIILVVIAFILSTPISYAGMTGKAVKAAKVKNAGKAEIHGSGKRQFEEVGFRTGEESKSLDDIWISEQEAALTTDIRSRIDDSTVTYLIPGHLRQSGTVHIVEKTEDGIKRFSYETATQSQSPGPIYMHSKKSGDGTYTVSVFNQHKGNDFAKEVVTLDKEGASKRIAQSFKDGKKSAMVEIKGDTKVGIEFKDGILNYAKRSEIDLSKYFTGRKINSVALSAKNPQTFKVLTDDGLIHTFSVNTRKVEGSLFKLPEAGSVKKTGNGRKMNAEELAQFKFFEVKDESIKVAKNISEPDVTIGGMDFGKTKPQGNGAK